MPDGMYVAALAELIEEFEKMPGIGRKSASRLAFYVMGLSEGAAKALAGAIITAKTTVGFCGVCQNLTDIDPCRICSSPKRDREIICVMESPRDVIALEKTREYKGQYHVLHGAISPMDGIGPDDIRLKELLKRLSNSEVKEVIMATNPTIEGEATAMYIARLIRPFGIKITRIAHGVPVGGDLEYADEVTLMRAIEGRREI